MEHFHTLEEAKQYLRANWEKGVRCPCCTQLVKMWKEPLHAGQAVWLIKLVKLYSQTNDWISVKDVNALAGMRGGDYAKLRHWGLVKSMGKGEDKTKRAAGMWMPTQKGIDFAENKIRVPKKTKTFDRKLLGFEGEMIDIVEALGDKFNYQELFQ